MDPIETLVLREPWEIEPRLAELGLSRKGLKAAASIATADRANATPFHAANAAGTFAYQSGTWALRDQFVGNAGWLVDRLDGIEAISNAESGVRVVFSNVDLACDDMHPPRPRSDKGAGAERACAVNLFGDLPTYAPRQKATSAATFYLMVDEAGAAELTRPVVKGGTFSAYVERIYLGGGDDGDTGSKLPLDDADTLTDFDPQVLRKS